MVMLTIPQVSSSSDSAGNGKAAADNEDPDDEPPEPVQGTVRAISVALAGIVPAAVTHTIVIDFAVHTIA